MPLPKLGAVGFVEDEDYLTLVDLKIGLSLHQAGELLDRRHDDLVVISLDITLKSNGAL